MARFIGAAFVAGAGTFAVSETAWGSLETTVCVPGNAFCPGENPFDVENGRWNDPGEELGEGTEGGGALQDNPGDSQQVRDAAEKSCDEQSSNPVVLTTGNKIQSFVDFAGEGEMGLYLRRTYNHYWRYPGLFGQHWVSNFDYSLVPQGTTVLWAQRPDGRRIKFLWNASASRFDEDKAAPIAYIVKHGDGSFTHYTEERTLETYSEFGYVRTVKNRQNIGWTFSYDTGNYLQSVSHTSGRTVQFTWTSGRLTRVTDPNGAQFDYDYDAHQFGANRHRLKSATLAGPPTTAVTYHYENALYPGALTGLSYAGVRHSTYSYDPQGRAQQTEHAGGQHRHSFVYNGSLTPPDDPPYDPPPPGGHCNPDLGVCTPEPIVPGIDPAELARRAEIAAAADAVLSQRVQMTSVVETNALGKQTEYRFQDGRMTEILGAASPHCAASYAARSYDANGYPRDVDDFNGNTIRNTYNAEGQLQTQVQGHGSPQARTIGYDWDVLNNRPNTITVTGDQRQTYTWRPDHRLGAITVRNLSGHGTPNQDRATSYSYTFHGNGLVATMTVDGPLPGSGDAIVSTYNAQGDLTQVRNSLNHAVNYSQHNGRGQPGRIVGANGEITEYQYDGRGRVTRLRTFRNGGQQDTTYVYAASGLLASLTTPDGVTISYTYDNARRLTHAAWNEPGGTVEQRLFYDNAGNVVREEVWRGSQLFTRAWTDYDELSRVRARRGNHGQHIRYAYDTNHNLVRITESLGQETSFVYDARNRLIRQTDALGGITHFAYDPGDRIVQVTDPRTRITHYDIDGFGQLWRQVSPDTGTTTLSWSAGGLRTSATRADGVTVSFGHDALGRPTTVSASGVTQTTTWDSASGCANGLGRICRIVDPHQTLVLGYTPYGELASQTPTISGGVGYGHSFEYDGLGRLRRIGYPDNVQVDYQRSLGQITGMTATINGQSRTVASGLGWAYDAGKPAHYFERTYGNGGQRRDYTDRDGRLYSIVSNLHQGFRYDFDANSRLTGLTNFAEPAGGLWSQTYAYDDLNRLTGATSAGLGNQGFQYDPNDNRTLHTRGGSVSDYAIAATSNRLTAITGAAARSYTYKATGQVTAISGALGGDYLFRNGFQTSPPPQTTFVHDAFNRLNSVTGPGVNAGYKVAATGMRVEKSSGGQTIRFVYGMNGQLLYERHLSPNQRSQYLYLNGQPIGLVRNGTLYYVLPDHLGRPEVIVNQNRDQVWRANLTAFERRVIHDQIGGYALGFPGQYHDPETGFAYNVHRDYDPATGRYVQSDPIGLLGGLNTYAYAGNDPISNIDPEGLFLYTLNEFRRHEHHIPRDLAYQIHMTPRVLTAGATLSMSGVYAGAALGPLLPEVGAGIVRACQSEPVKKVTFATCVTIGLCTTDKPKGIGQIARDRERTAEIARMTTQQARRLWQRFVKEN